MVSTRNLSSLVRCQIRVSTAPQCNGLFVPFRQMSLVRFRSRATCKRALSAAEAMSLACNAMQRSWVRALQTSATRKSSVPDPQLSPSSSASSVDEGEVGRFASMASDWWNERGSLKALHSMNELRIPWIRDTLFAYGIAQRDGSGPLSKVKLMDVGCGAGLLSEPLARLGAQVTGLDAAEECVDAARDHCSKDPSISERLNYVCNSAEDFLAENPDVKLDAVVASEILEHVADRESFIEALAGLTRPGGALFLTTLNKTWLSKVLGIYAAENILAIVPQGIHDWEKFTKPKDLQFLLQKNGCTVRMVHGMAYNPITNRWSWCRDRNINYAIHAVKN